MKNFNHFWTRRIQCLDVSDAFFFCFAWVTSSMVDLERNTRCIVNATRTTRSNAVKFDSFHHPKTIDHRTSTRILLITDRNDSRIRLIWHKLVLQFLFCIIAPFCTRFKKREFVLFLGICNMVTLGMKIWGTSSSVVKDRCFPPSMSPLVHSADFKQLEFRRYC